jgi:hypothetical protein
MKKSILVIIKATFLISLVVFIYRIGRPEEFFNFFTHPSLRNFEILTDIPILTIIVLSISSYFSVLFKLLPDLIFELILKIFRLIFNGICKLINKLMNK